MSTIEAGPETAHGDHDHDHPSFLAHHFDTPEQQFDSGKLGIWLFLVTEILFFSGMFCAYAMFRMLRPDVFEGCSQFLNTKLGAINTGVLLFSSLTMAWAVRCSQTEDHKGLTVMLSATLSCAMVFLGVKAIEYSHKWAMGLLPAGLFFYDPANPHPPDQPNYLLYICAPFAVALIGVVIWLVVSIVRSNQFQIACAKPLTVVCAFFFVGVGLGAILESGGSESHAGEHAAVAHDSHTAAEEHAEVADGEIDDDAVRRRLASEQTNSGLQSELATRELQTELAGTSIVSDEDQITGPISSVEQNVMTPGRAGVFFSIYYCMTGVHAIHILGGIVVLVWLLIRSIRQDFNRHYFGPVDYVGLYWHLVDLIWIYLFPLLYLIR
jgi:cytochrome c oxidase subunit 3